MFSFWQKILSRLETTDLWFLVLRVATILVGMVWYHWVPYDAATQFIFGLLLSGFVVYTVILYVCIFLWPGRIRAFYLLAMAVDLLFIFSLVGYVDKQIGRASCRERG